MPPDLGEFVLRVMAGLDGQDFDQFRRQIADIKAQAKEHLDKVQQEIAKLRADLDALEQEILDIIRQLARLAPKPQKKPDKGVKPPVVPDDEIIRDFQEQHQADNLARDFGEQNKDIFGGVEEVRQGAQLERQIDEVQNDLLAQVITDLTTLTKFPAKIGIATSAAVKGNLAQDEFALNASVHQKILDLTNTNPKFVQEGSKLVLDWRKKYEEIDKLKRDAQVMPANTTAEKKNLVATINKIKEAELVLADLGGQIAAKRLGARLSDVVRETVSKLNTDINKFHKSDKQTKVDKDLASTTRGALIKKLKEVLNPPEIKKADQKQALVPYFRRIEVAIDKDGGAADLEVIVKELISPKVIKFDGKELLAGYAEFSTDKKDPNYKSSRLNLLNFFVNMGLADAGLKAKWDALKK